MRIIPIFSTFFRDGTDRVLKFDMGSGEKYMKVGFYRCITVLSMMTIIDITGLAVAQTQPSPVQMDNQDVTATSGDTTQEGVVTYTSEFLMRYQPNTALDMVNRIPGFTLNNGGGRRGFGGAAGNILINDRRPSTKQDLPSAILGRISADLVDRIELIRVKVRDIDLLGQNAVVNVILKADAPAAIRWEAYIRFNFDYGTTPFTNISLSDRWGAIDYNAGFEFRKTYYGDPGVIERFNANGTLTEIRDDADRAHGHDLNGYLNASTWLGKNFVQLNTSISDMPRVLVTTSTLFPQLPVAAPQVTIFSTNRDIRIYEVGLDAERVISSDLLGKAILLFSRNETDPSSSQQNFNTSGVQTRLQLEDESTIRTESIARLEFDWAGLDDHALQADVEYAMNALDNSLVFTDDTGSGPVVVDVPGSNNRVEEARWNFVVQDTWSLGKFDWNYGVTFERSTISQSGDAINERSFNYVKPRTVLTYSPTPRLQTSMRIEREVSQLNFNDFVTATVFEDGNVTLGNPDLQPDRTWITELSQELRFGSVGVVKLTAFHHKISDVLDLLPLSPTFETTGNIGDGTKTGVILTTTLPLERLGLTGARLDFKVRWQDTKVVDPITGLDRTVSIGGGFRGEVVFTGDTDYAYAINYRQDFEAARVSWGLGLAERGERVLFKADELDINNEKFEMTGFIETTRWFGLKITLQGQNMLDNPQSRDRTIYTGERGLTPVLLRELRKGGNGAMLFVKVSGSF